MADLKNHPGMWLRDDAAAAINALEDKYGVIRINSAGRTVAQQKDLIWRFDAGEPGIFKPARPAETSNHVRNGGIAVDVYNYTDDRAKLEEFGFKWFGPTDKVHYDFQGWSPAPAPAPAAVVTDAGGAVNGVLGPNPFGIPYTGGLQKVANKYLPHGGYRKTALDQNFGPTSMHGFSEFLRRNYGYVGNDVLGPVMWAAIARWLRATNRYSGNDVPGPVMRAALSKADTENWAAL